MRKRRCGAKCHYKEMRCRRWAVPGRERCRLHGGLSTGPRTKEGKAAAGARIVAVRAKHKALGIHTGGRRKGLLDKRQLAQVTYVPDDPIRGVQAIIRQTEDAIRRMAEDED